LFGGVSVAELASKFRGGEKSKAVEMEYFNSPFFWFL